MLWSLSAVVLTTTAPVADITVTPDVSSNQLLGKILDEVEIVGFNEILPSMNEVFIKVVEQSNLSNQ